ncbi:hypothetical protein [uncultured Fusobacterium sp.]|uniref:hypothetical protein n=1 Tax=uncultured Fusobacterium sp. TaxID=159267 RepID=UPI0027DE4FA8|nr:hypothetical protein [uncultured Fusobacterium sp.]
MEIKIKESQNKIEIMKDDSKEYAKISKYNYIFFFLSIIVFFIFFKEIFSIFTFLFYILTINLPIYFLIFGIKNKYMNEVMEVNLENIKLEFLKDGDIVYSKKISREKVIKIKKEMHFSRVYLRNTFADIMNEELVSKRRLKIITKDEVFSWGYKVEEEKIDEIIKLIKKFWNMED